MMPIAVNDRNRATLQIAVLGPPVVTCNSTSLSIPRRQARALLYRLVVPLTPVPRTQLGYLFWPDVPETTARRNLTHLLTLLRRALPEPALLLTAGETIAVHPRHIWSDADSFTRLIRTADVQARLGGLTEALDLYRGPLLDGFALPLSPEWEAWRDLERSTWERRVDDALSAVVEAHTIARNYAAAIAAAQRYLQRDELAEGMHRRLIALYAAAGDRTAALRQFERCVVTLERELGVAPLPETRMVYEAVRDGTSPLPPAAPAAVRSVTLARPTSVTTGIPIPPTPLIGRAVVLGDLLRLLGRDEIRLVTLAGPGGVGKTRLALEGARSLADAFADGVCFVPLAPLRDPALVLPAIGAALGLGERDNRPPLVRLQDALRTRTLLLILDNFEHVVAAGPDIGALLQAAPGLKLLVTSRGLLRLAGEQAYAVPPLDLPDPAHLPPLADLAAVGAVALFLARVREREPHFHLSETNAAEIAAICARLDGLPLALELAASRAGLLSPRMLLARLDRRLALLTDGPRDLPERQRTLRATVDWSYDLLDVGEQLLLGRLAVFAGGWTLDAAEQVAVKVGPLTMSVLDGLQVLLDKHLVQHVVGSDGDPRFTMLETIREYALERLEERGEVVAALQAHAAYFLALAEQAAPALHGPDQIAWFDRLDDELANLRVALMSLLDGGVVGDALRATGALYWFWFVRGHVTEGLAWLECALAVVDASDVTTGTPLIARARYAAAHLTFVQGDLVTAGRMYAESVAAWQSLVDAAADHMARQFLIRSRFRLALTHALRGDPAAQTIGPEIQSAASDLADRRLLAEVAQGTGRGLLQHGDTTGAQALLREAQATFRDLGDVWSLAQVQVDLGMLAMLAGDTTAARQWYTEAVASARMLKDRGCEADALNNLGEIARLDGADAIAAEHYAASLRLYRELSSRVEIQRLIHNLGFLALHAGDVAQGRAHFMASLAGFRAIGQARGAAEAIAGLAALAAEDGRPESACLAARLWGAADTTLAVEGVSIWPADRAERAHYEALARATVGAVTFDLAYAEGTTLALTQASDAALRM